MKVRKPLKKTSKRAGGSLTTTVSITDNISKEEIHREEKSERLPAVTIPEGYSVGTVRAIVGVTISANFSSVRLDIGGEMPWPMRPGNVKDFSAGLDKFEDVVEAKAASKVPEVEELLSSLAYTKSK